MLPPGRRHAAPGIDPRAGIPRRLPSCEPRHHSAPTTSAACSARSSCSPPGTTSRPAARRGGPAGNRGRRRSPRPSRRQQEAGLQAATDGEFRRASWHMDFIYQLGGISKAPGELRGQVPQPSRATIEFTPGRAAASTARSALDQTIFGDDFRFLQSVVTTGDAQAHDPLAEHGPLPRRACRASTRTSTPTSTGSGATCPRPTRRRSGGSASSAAPTCSSTTPASPT